MTDLSGREPAYGAIGSDGTECEVDETLVPQIIDVFKARLKRDTCGPDDDFFALGGSSFMGVLCISDLQKQGIEAKLQDLLAAKTPRKLAQRIKAPRQAG
ncbi:phosphopantetheine-binding protein [Streptosporangium sandarakinum]